MNKKIIATIFILLLTAFTAVPISAQGIVVDNPGDIGLQPITIPTFLSLEAVRQFSPLSYASMLGALIIIIIAMSWVVIVIRAALLYLRSQGDEGMIETSSKKLTNLFISISILFAFCVAISIVASWLGVGHFWDWPKAFSYCSSDFSRDPNAYYFQYFLNRSSQGANIEQIDTECFGD